MIAAAHAQTYGTFTDHVRSIGLVVVVLATIVVLPKIGRALLAREWRPHTPARAGRARRVVGHEPKRTRALVVEAQMRPGHPARHQYRRPEPRRSAHR